MAQLRSRRSIAELQNAYLKGDKKPLEDLMRAWKGIKERPPTHPQSFFAIGGFHGEPFRGPGATNRMFWGGWCHHGNVLFPTWHRVYLVKLEEALQSVPGCQDVMLPYWDETGDDSLRNGIPWALTQNTFVLDGKTIPNPLKSFVLTAPVVDTISGDVPNYTKPRGYETVRYPLSGLVGTFADRSATRRHNAKFPNHEKNVELLNRNVIAWLTSQITVDKSMVPANVARNYALCLDAPNYTAFSNITSSAAWNAANNSAVTSLEHPHNSIHVAVGGFDMPGAHFSPIHGANGDMGENDTAALDPIFYFHHCFVDRIFWLWQKQNGFTDNLYIIESYPGTNSSDAQGPTPNMAPNTPLTLDTPLDPFTMVENGMERMYTSRDCMNIERQLGFTYGPGSLENAVVSRNLPPGMSTKVMRITQIDRSAINGSFLVCAYVTIGGKKHLIGTKAFLSRWNVRNCANCLTHMEAQAFFSLSGFKDLSLRKATFDAEIRTRNRALRNTAKRQIFHMEVA